MKIVWDWSLESEASRLVEMCHHATSGFYQLHHFLPLPFDPSRTRPNATHHVYLPHLAYHTIPRFWEDIAKLNTLSPLPSSRYDTTRLLPLLSTLQLPPLSLPTLHRDSLHYLPLVAKWLKATFPSVSLPDTTTIHPSYFGTSGSFDWSSDNRQITLSLRYDNDLHSLTEIFLSAILRPHAITTLYRDWEKTEYLVDYLILSSTLSTIIPPPKNWQPTTIPPHYSQSLLNESKTFLKTIGASTSSPDNFFEQEGQIYFDNTPLTSLNHKEYLLLSALISRTPNPLTLDQIGDLIFSKDEKFSLSAITKVVERLRNKFDDLGISSSHIATASGVGYYLKN